METRELFERLVTDEPPLRLSPASALGEGRRAARRRWSVTTVGAVAVVVLSSGLVVRLAGDHRASVVAGPTPTPTTAAGPLPTPPATGLPASFNAATLPFVSLAQVQEAANQEYGPMNQGVSALSGGANGGVIGGSGGRSATKLVERLQYDGPSSSVFLQLTVAAPAAARKAYGRALSEGPCAAPIPDRPRATTCTAATLPGGGTLWSWQAARTAVAGSGTPAEVLQRSALVVAADGSCLEVLQGAQQQHGSDAVALPTDRTIPEATLISIAEHATVTWVSASRAFVGPGSATVSSPAGPAVGGPGITALPFRSVSQITASNNAVYTRLVAAAGGKSALIKGWPTLQSGRISAKTTTLRTEVQWPLGKNSAYLDVVTSNASDARNWYGPALASGRCVSARGQAVGAPVSCTSSPLPGGAQAWAWTTRSGIGEPAKGQRGPTSVATVARNVLVVAKDGSTLALTEFALSGHQPGTGTFAAIAGAVPDTAALVPLAAQLAQAWESAAS